MISFKDIETYLPKYNTPRSNKELYEGLAQFPDNIDARFYTSALNDEEVIYQGDGIKKLLFVNFPDKIIKEKDGMIISNSCDISLENKRNYPINLAYAPIIKLSSFLNLLEQNKVDAEKISKITANIRKQHVTQIFYLPESGSLGESIVFLDKINSCSNEYVDRTQLKDLRIFTLSNYGWYVFIVKLSMHFTRVFEKIDRAM